MRFNFCPPTLLLQPTTTDAAPSSSPTLHRLPQAAPVFLCPLNPSPNPPCLCNVTSAYPFFTRGFFGYCPLVFGKASSGVCAKVRMLLISC